MDANLLDWSAVPLQQFAGGATKRIIHAENCEFVQVEVPAGLKSAAHEHPYWQVATVVSGEGYLETAQGRARFSAGSIFHFPPQTWHAADFETHTVLIEANIGVPKPEER